jgi:hypothetical protein
VREAEGDVAEARVRGDKTFAELRRTDASELRQDRLDWGDRRTWAILFAMFFGFLLLVAVCYFLPAGRHAAPPPIRIY